MQLTTWGDVQTTSEVVLSDFEEFTGQRFLEVLQRYSPDFRAVFSVTPDRPEDMGIGGWAGKIVSLKLGVHTSDESIVLSCYVWVVRNEAQAFSALVMNIKVPDGRELHFIYDGHDCVRAVYWKDRNIYNVWGKMEPQPLWPDLGKFFVLDVNNSN